MTVTATDPTAAVAAATTNTSNPNAVLGKDDFLQLLVAQLQNQDPLSPMDGSQFAAQLAQFSTVEQLTQLNTAATAQTTALTQSQFAQQTQLGASLIGRDVITNGSTVTVADKQDSRISVDLGGPAQTVHIDILAADGKTVLGSQDFDNLPTGTSTLTVDTGKIPAGSYSYKVSAVDSSNVAVNATGYTVGTVTGTLFQNGEVMVRVNGTPVNITDLVEIIPSETKTATTDTASTTTTPQ